MVLGYVTILEAMDSILQTIKTSVFSSSSLQEWPQTTLFIYIVFCGSSAKKLVKADGSEVSSRKGVFFCFFGLWRRQNCKKTDGIYTALCAFPAQSPVNCDGFKLCRLQSGHKDPADSSTEVRLSHTTSPLFARCTI